MSDSKKMMKAMLIGGVLGFVFVFIYEFLVHGVLLKGLYDSTSSVWRPQEEANMFVMALSHFLFALAIAFFYPVVGPDKNCKKAIPFGFGLGLVLAMPQIATYSYLPIPFSISICWALAGFFKAFGTSFIIGKVFHKMVWS